MAKNSSPALFDYLNAISYGRPDVIAKLRHDLSAYNDFMINRGLSQSYDTALLANEMNRCYHLPSVMKYDFLAATVRKRKRFGGWAKKTQTSNDLQVIMDYYSYTLREATSVLPLLPASKIAVMKAKLQTGRMNK